MNQLLGLQSRDDKFRAVKFSDKNYWEKRPPDLNYLFSFPFSREEKTHDSQALKTVFGSCRFVWKKLISIIYYFLIISSTEIYFWRVMHTSWTISRELSYVSFLFRWGFSLLFLLCIEELFFFHFVKEKKKISEPFWMDVLPNAAAESYSTAVDTGQARMARSSDVDVDQTYSMGCTVESIHITWWSICDFFIHSACLLLVVGTVESIHITSEWWTAYHEAHYTLSIQLCHSMPNGIRARGLEWKSEIISVGK